MPALNRITWHELNEKGLPENTAAVINVAGQNVLDPTRRWTPGKWSIFHLFSSLSQRIDRTNFFFFLLSGFKQNVWTSRINTASAFVRAIASAKSKPDVFINLSGVSAYRPSDTKIYTEDDKGEEYDFMSKLCLNWEQAAELPPSENVRLVWNSHHIFTLIRIVIKFILFNRYALVVVSLLAAMVAW